MKKLAPLLVLPCFLLLVQCSDTQNIPCPCGQELNADGTDCVPIPCEGGDLTSCACVCPGGQTLADGICTDTACVDVDCNDDNECTDDDCEGGVCNNNNVADDTTCDAAGAAGVCKSGTCEVDRCADVDCTKNECRTGDTCNTSSGECEGGSNAAVDTSCDQDGGKVCDGAGNCVECNGPAQCADGMECTDDLCDTSDGSCSYPNVEDIQCNGGDGVCENGACVPAPAPCVNNPCPDDDNNCTSTQCTADGNDRICEYPNTGEGVLCDGETDKVCDGQGNCVGCLVDDDCPPDSDVCTAPSCDAGVCGNNNPANEGGICTTGAALDGTCQNGVCDPGPPTATLIEPSNPNSPIEPDAAIIWEFDRPMNGNTIDGSSFIVRAAASTSLVGRPADGMVSYDESTKRATFTPEGRLTLTVSYRAELSTAIEDTAGRSLPVTESPILRVRDGEWALPAENVFTGRVVYPRVAVSASGNGIVTWVSQSELWWIRMTPTTMTNATRVNAATSGQVSNGQSDVKMDADGFATAMWAETQQGSATASMKTSRLAPNSSTWPSAVRVDIDDGGFTVDSRPQLSVNPAGIALAVWRSSAETAIAGAPAAQGTWTQRTLLQSGADVGALLSPQVDIRSDGTGAAIWHDSTTNQVFSSLYTGSGWTLARRRDTTGDAGVPGIAVDNDGNAMAVWRHNQDGNNNRIYYRQYRADLESWLDPDRLDESDSSNADNQVMADGAGNYTFLWAESRTTIRARRWRGELGSLESIITLTPSSGESARDPDLAVEPFGTALAIWYREDGGIWANRFRSGEPWTQPQKVGNVASGEAIDFFRPRVALRPDGTAAAVWVSGDEIFGDRDLFVARFE